MKKLSLKNLNFGKDDLLDRKDLKTVFGGYEGGPCTVNCENGMDFAAPDCSSTTTTLYCQNWGGAYYCGGPWPTCSLS